MQQNLFSEDSPILETIIDKPSKHNSCHYQLAVGEIWLGNTTKEKIDDDCMHLKTIRLGTQAYCIEGKPIDPKHVLPLFIHKSEEQEYDRIMMARMKKINR